MARFKVQITKMASFQGKFDEWSNVYCYEGGLTDPNFDNLVNAIVAAEKAVHNANVTFLRANVWDVGVPPNTMRLTKELSGAGTQAGSLTLYRECCYLVKWPLPRSTSSGTSRQRSLKKYIHSCSVIVGTDSTGTVVLPAIGSTPFNAYANAITDPIAGGAQLVSPSGAVPDGPAVLHPYIEHHQFPRGRKRSGGILG